MGLKNFFLGTALLLVLMISCKGNMQKKDSENKSKKVTLMLKHQAKLGEGAFWDHRHQRFYWVDIESSQVHRFDPVTGKNETFEMPSRVGTVVPIDEDSMIVALEDGVYNYSISKNKITVLAEIESDKPENRFNDGKCDPEGSLWVGSMSLNTKDPSGALYRVDPDGKVEKFLDSVTVSNGIVWTKDKKIMYYIDTPTGWIRAYDYDPSKRTISNERIAVEIPESLGYGDGMAIDENDELWVALWNGNGIAHFDPQSGKLIKKIEIPAHNVTSCSFGGKDLDVLMVTTASIDMNEDEKLQFPDAGSLFSFKPGVKGQKGFYFGQK